jgi:hypothetical protein
MPQLRPLRDAVDLLVELGESRRSPLHHSRARSQWHSFQAEIGPPTFWPAAPRSRRRTVAGFAAILMIVGLLGLVSGKGSSGNGVAQSQADLIGNIIPVADRIPAANGSAGSASIANDLGSRSPKLAPAQPGAVVAPALPKVASEPPLLPHEVFGFAPYWTLDDNPAFDLNGLTTVAYFSVGINADGSVDTSDAGWQGFNSQDLVDLVDRAHAAGDRVVLTVTNFSQSSLDQLTSSSSAPAELAQNLLFMIREKSLDGVNLDFEGEGSGDQAGLTNLVSVVSSTLHAANPNYQVTMDTYASSAGDPAGFYDIPALSRVVDGFFVMAYQLNLSATSSAESPMTSSMFSNQEAAEQYAKVVPGDKVILGLALFGYDWPTSDGTLGAQPQGAPATVTYAQEVASGHPMYWDADTDTAWTSYQVGQQWHEAFFEDPNSLYMGAQLAQEDGLAGVGAWALGMDGSDDNAVVSALDGNAPADKDGLAGPSSTSASTGSSGVVTGNLPTAPSSGGSSPTTGGSGGTSSTTSTTPTGPTTTTTTVPSLYEGTWQDVSVELDATSTTIDQSNLTWIGTLSGFATNDPIFQCLTAEPTLQVYSLSTDPDHDYVLAQTPNDCVDGAFTFATAGLPTTGTTSTTTTTAPASREPVAW